MAQILFDYGATTIPILAETKDELMNAIVDGMLNEKQLENLHHFKVDNFLLRKSNYEYDGPIEVKVISKEA
jgi:hypothetical protein